jgi:hypothetical protein
LIFAAELPALQVFVETFNVSEIQLKIFSSNYLVAVAVVVVSVAGTSDNHPPSHNNNHLVVLLLVAVAVSNWAWSQQIKSKESMRKARKKKVFIS